MAVALCSRLILSSVISAASASGPLKETGSDFKCGGFDFTSPVTMTVAATDPALKILAGRVGLGTAIPAAQLHIVGTPSVQMDGFGATAATTFRRAGGTSAIPTAVTAGTILGGLYFNGYGASAWGAGTGAIKAIAVQNFTNTANGMAIAFATVPVGSTVQYERLRIDHQGYVGVGTSVPAAPLDVNGVINTSAGLSIAGTPICTASGCASPSDARLKMNVQPIEGALAKIELLQGVSYNWKNEQIYGSNRQIGFLAQDLEKTFPEVVRTDANTGIKTVAYDHLVAGLVEAMKDLSRQVREQQRQIDQLRQQVK